MPENSILMAQSPPEVAGQWYSPAGNWMMRNHRRRWRPRLGASGNCCWKGHRPQGRCLPAGERRQTLRKTTWINGRKLSGYLPPSRCRHSDSSNTPKRFMCPIAWDFYMIICDNFIPYMLSPPFLRFLIRGLTETYRKECGN